MAGLSTEASGSVGLPWPPSVSQPEAAVLTQEGPVTTKEGSAPSSPGRATVEPEALWLEMTIKDRKSG